MEKYDLSRKKIEALMQNKEWKIDHVEDFLDVMGTIDNEERFEKIKEKVIKNAEKEEITMFSIAEELENRGKAAGLKEGKAAGLKEGKAAGVKEGKASGKIEGLLLAKVILKLDADGKSIREIATECAMDEKEIRKFLEK